MNILLTGGLGYIGSHLALGLLKNKKTKLTIVDDLSNAKLSTKNTIKYLSKKKFKFKKLDLKNKNKLQKLFKVGKFDLIFHLAGSKSVKESQINPKKYYENNVIGSINLLHAMIENNVKNIIFSSTATVYGLHKKNCYSENFSREPINTYGLTKKIIEDLLIDLKEKNQINTLILRYFNPAGCHISGLLGENPQGIPNNLYPYIIKIIKGEVKYLKIFGNNYKTKDGTGARDYIHIQDLVDAHLKCIKLVKKKSDIFNIGTGRPYTVLDIINSFKKYCNFKINYNFYSRREGDIDIYYNKISKAKKKLGWSAKRGLKEISQSTFNFAIKSK
ncbi:UDP-glucose 4-epimerase GalE [Candidatus Pelagibacter bacterium nBUS_44]|uniref:UDP-glucose 4-epimerase GalE n=1 Tax=Candidatus Pelagibacter bacterium nBUS_44 TaxID=3374195 RepID=UPI003EBC618F